MMDMDTVQITNIQIVNLMRQNNNLRNNTNHKP